MKRRETAHVRYAGSDTALEIIFAGAAAMRRGFEKAHRSRFGFVDRVKPLVVEAVAVEAIGGAARFAERAGAIDPHAPPPVPAVRTRFFSHGAWRDAGVFQREVWRSARASPDRR